MFFTVVSDSYHQFTHASIHSQKRLNILIIKKCINFHLFSVFLSVCTLTIALTASMASPTNVEQQFAKAANLFATELYQVS